MYKKLFASAEFSRLETFGKYGLKMLEQIKRFAGVTLDNPATARNFKIITLQKPAGEIELILKHNQSNQEIKISQYLKPGQKITTGAKFLYNKESKAVTIDKTKEPAREFLLSLFHELGHAQQKKHKSAYSIISKPFMYALLRTQKMPLLLRFVFSFVLNSFGQYLAKKLIQFEGNSEKNAWEYAKQELKKLQAKGYNVFDGYADEAEINKFIDYCLFTHETTNQYSRLCAGAKNIEKEKAMFL